RRLPRLHRQYRRHQLRHRGGTGGGISRKDPLHRRGARQEGAAPLHHPAGPVQGAARAGEGPGDGAKGGALARQHRVRPLLGSGEAGRGDADDRRQVGVREGGRRCQPPGRRGAGRDRQAQPGLHRGPRAFRWPRRPSPGRSRRTGRLDGPADVPGRGRSGRAALCVLHHRRARPAPPRAAPAGSRRNRGAGHDSLLLRPAGRGRTSARRAPGLRRHQRRPDDRHPAGARDVSEPGLARASRSLRARPRPCSEETRGPAGAGRRHQLRPAGRVRARGQRQERGGAACGKDGPAGRRRAGGERGSHGRRPGDRGGDPAGDPGPRGHPTRGGRRRAEDAGHERAGGVGRSRFFIERPILANVVAIVIVLLGLVCLLSLPVAQYPNIVPPTIQVSTSYPGASADLVATTVGIPIEQALNGVENSFAMQSTSGSDGSYTLTLTFNVGTNLDTSIALVQNAVNGALSQMPNEVQTQGVSVQKVSTSVLLIGSLYSDDDRFDETFLSNYAIINLQSPLARLPGVGQVQVLGAGPYSMRIWLDPVKLKAYGLTVLDVQEAIKNQNVQVAAGQLGGPPVPADQIFQFTVSTLGRLSDVSEFEGIIIK